jgi:hypothetical protein
MAAQLFRLDEETYQRLVNGGKLLPLEERQNEGGEEEEVVAVVVPTVQEVAKARWELLQHALGLKGVEDNPRSLIVFEFIYNIVQFCCQQSTPYSYAQMGAVLSVFGDVFEACFVAGDVGSKTRDDAIAMYTAQMSQYARGEALLDVVSVKRITDLFSETIIKQFDAYRYVMTELPTERVERVNCIVQTPRAQHPPLVDEEKETDQDKEEKEEES